MPEDELPVVLPQIDEYRPDAPTAGRRSRAPKDWLHTTDAETGQPATRETNTMPQWAGSCWYYLRFLSPNRDDVAWDPDEEKYWMPVDLYVGGAEHAVLHLLYARFWHKVLFDAGLRLDEGAVPAPVPPGHDPQDRRSASRRAASTTTTTRSSSASEQRWFVEGRRGTPVDDASSRRCRSRSYNVVNPDDMCAEYGADAMRLYELFMGPLEDGVEWETAGVVGHAAVPRPRVAAARRSGDRRARGKVATTRRRQRELERALHARDQEGHARRSTDLRFNTAISEMMVFVNEATKAPAGAARRGSRRSCEILSPFAPHLAEELWQRLGHTRRRSRTRRGRRTTRRSSRATRS